MWVRGKGYFTWVDEEPHPRLRRSQWCRCRARSGWGSTWCSAGRSARARTCGLAQLRVHNLRPRSGEADAAVTYGAVEGVLQAVVPMREGQRDGA
jgi:hypothetical protein